MRKYLPLPHKFRPKTLDSTDTVDFTHFRRTVNRYCVHYAWVISEYLSNYLFGSLFAIHLGTKEINFLQLVSRNSLIICITFVQGFKVHLNAKTEILRAYRNTLQTNTWNVSKSCRTIKVIWHEVDNWSKATTLDNTSLLFSERDNMEFVS